MVKQDQGEKGIGELEFRASKKTGHRSDFEPETVEIPRFVVAVCGKKTLRNFYFRINFYTVNFNFYKLYKTFFLYTLTSLEECQTSSDTKSGIPSVQN